MDEERGWVLKKDRKLICRSFVTLVESYMTTLQLSQYTRY